MDRYKLKMKLASASPVKAAPAETEHSEPISTAPVESVDGKEDVNLTDQATEEVVAAEVVAAEAAAPSKQKSESTEGVKEAESEEQTSVNEKKDSNDEEPSADTSSAAPASAAPAEGEEQQEVVSSEPVEGKAEQVMDVEQGDTEPAAADAVGTDSAAAEMTSETPSVEAAVAPEPAPASEPVTASADSTNNTTAAATEAEPAPKRRRRTGWDTPSPAAAPAVIVPPPLPTGPPPQQNIAAPPLGPPPTPAYSAPAQSYVSAPYGSAVTSGLTPQQIAQQILASKPNLSTIVGGVPTRPECRIYVGSLHYDLREPDIIQLFSAFGKVTRCDLGVEMPTGKSKGYCFLEFAEPHMAEASMVMNGFDLAGRKIKVGRPTQPGSGQSSIMGGMGMSMGGMGMAGMGMAGMHYGQTSLGMAGMHAGQMGMSAVPPVLSAPVMAPPAPLPVTGSTTFITICIKNELSVAQVQDIFSLHGAIKNVKRLTATRADSSRFYDLLIEFHDASSASIAAGTMNGHVLSGQRLDVMLTSLNQAIELMIQTVETSSSRCVLLENMVTLEDTKDPGLKDEVAEEAMQYGKLVDVEIIVNNREGSANVKLHYAEPSDASKAHKALGGRLFAGRKIRATLVV